MGDMSNLSGAQESSISRMPVTPEYSRVAFSQQQQASPQHSQYFPTHQGGGGGGFHNSDPMGSYGIGAGVDLEDDFTHRHQQDQYEGRRKLAGHIGDPSYGPMGIPDPRAPEFIPAVYREAR